MRILLVEDDTVLGSAIRDEIHSFGHAVDWAQRIDDASNFVAEVAHDLILLDLMLPDGRGLDFLKQIRSGGHTSPVIILTALDQISNRISGLNAGADDYMIKPFDLSELSARIGAVARRYTTNPNPLHVLLDVEINLASRSIHRGGRSIRLTAREWALMEALLQRPEATLSKEYLETRMYALDSEFNSNTIEVNISRLRKKLGFKVIETIRGVGYRLHQS